MMFPSSPNLRVKLLKIMPNTDDIGNVIYECIGSKEVIAISKQVTSKEYYESKRENYKVDMAVKINAFLYDGSKYAIINDLLYKIERTYLNGQFIELYMMESIVKIGDLIGNT